MDIKPEQLIEYLGLPEVKTFDEFKEKFESPEGFAKRSIIDKEIGKTLGAATTKVKAITKEYGIEFDPEEIKDKQIADIHKLALEKLNTKLQDLENKQSQNNDEQIQTLTEQINQYKISLDSEKKAKRQVQEEYEKTKTTFETQLKDYKKNTEFDKAWGEVSKKFAPGVDDLKIRGFKSLLNEQRDFDFDEDGKFYVKDKTTGEKIPSGKKAGEFKTPVEDLLELADKAGMLPKNPDAGKPAPSFFGNQRQPEQAERPTNRKTLNPAALKASGLV